MSTHNFHVLLFFGYIFISTAVMIHQGIGLSPDRYLVVLFVPAFFIHRLKAFIHDFLPFILIILAYDFFRGFADNLNSHIDYQLPIQNTLWLFSGHIPTVELQKAFYTPGFLHWYDYAASFLYILHFVTPLVLAYILWVKKRRYFQELATGYVLVSYSALIAYLIHPTAPPWLASEKGFIPPLTKILSVVLSGYPETFHFPTAYQWIGGNLVAAIPSLHTGYSFLVFLYAYHFFGKKGLIVAPYFLLMWLTIVYLGEHYFVDIVFGALFAFVAFKLSLWIVPRFHKQLDLI